MLYLAFNRFLVAAKPPAPEDDIRRRDFDEWRDQKVEQFLEANRPV